MTSIVPPASARQTLGAALCFFRSQRKLSQRDLADRVGCSALDIADWERGKSAPPDHRWERLCKLLHDLADMRVSWQRARAEEEREKAEQAKAPATGRLTSKPFANLPTLALVPVSGVTPPTTLHDDGFDLRPAYKAVAKLPEGWRSAEAITKRKLYAVELIKRGFTSDDVYKEVKRKFGVGIGAPVLTELRAEVREAKTREIQAARGLTEPEAPSEAAPRAPAPAPVEVPMSLPTPTPPKPEPAPAPPQNDIEGAVRLILEALPNLKTFKIEVSDNGEVSVDHVMREVRVIETVGSMKLRKP